MVYMCTSTACKVDILCKASHLQLCTLFCKVYFETIKNSVGQYLDFIIVHSVTESQTSQHTENDNIMPISTITIIFHIGTYVHLEEKMIQNVWNTFSVHEDTSGTYKYCQSICPSCTIKCNDYTM